MAALKPLLEEVRSNARLRWGMWMILGILWLYAVLLLRDQVPREADLYQSASRKLARAQATASQTHWAARRSEAMAAQTSLEGRLWTATSMGLAQASFNDWLVQAAQQSGVARPTISVAAQEESLEGMPGMWKVTARASFDFSPQTFYPLLARIGSYDKAVLVESLVIRGSPTPRADIVLLAHFRNARALAAPKGRESS
jgi:hypothetical protein